MKSIDRRDVALRVVLGGIIATIGATTSGQSTSTPSGRDPAPSVAGDLDHRVRIYSILGARSGQPEAAIADESGLFVAGSLRDGAWSSLWLWRIDDAGERLWIRELAHSERGYPSILGLLPGSSPPASGAPGPGVRVVLDEGTTTLLSVDPNGEITSRRSLGGLRAEQFVEGRDGSFFLLGTGRVRDGGPRRAWVARVSGEGLVRWKRFYRAPGDLGPAEEQEASAPPGYYPSTSWVGGVFHDGGSLSLVGQSGIYNKFGQGDSRLWLLRIGGDGTPEAEAVIPDGRVFDGGLDSIASCGDGIVTLYTTEQLPSICGAPLDFPLDGFEIRLARFDGELRRVWDTPFGQTSLPGAAAVTGPAPFVMLTDRFGELFIQGIDDQGKKQWKVEIGDLEGSCRPVATARGSQRTVAVFGHFDFDDRKPKVLLVEIEEPQ